MTAKLISELPPEEMTDIIRRAVQARLEQGTKAGDASPPRTPEKLAPGRPMLLLQVRPSYSIADFLQFHDEAFVVNAFVGLLQRKPDDKTLRKWLRKLRAGTTRLEILRELRFSEEGKGRNVRVLGLSFPDSANVLMSRRQLIDQQIKTVWSKKHRRLKNQIRSLKQRVFDLERQVMPIEPPPAAAEKMDSLLRAWEVRLNSQGERISRAMDRLQERLDDLPADPTEVGIRAAAERRTFGS
jgi:hypothetical protein